jgi:tripartite-type tricarboxylate transporter receptor subunit TctC
MNAPLRRLRLHAWVLLGLCVAGAAAAQAPDASRFPVKPIRLILPFAGGSTEVMARLLAQKLTERLGQQAIVDPRTGAAGIIGNDLAARSPADGCTLLIVSEIAKWGRIARQAGTRAE